MSDEIQEFHHDLFQEVVGDADANNRFLEEAFLTHFTEHLIDAGEFDTFDPAYYRAPTKGVRVDGYAGDPLENEGVLTLFVADFHPQDKAGTLTRSEAEKIFKRLENFYTSSLKPDFYIQMEESSPGFGLAEMINRSRDRLTRVRLFLLSNRVLSSRADAIPNKSIDGVPVTFSIWDVSRLFRLVTSKKEREDIDIDFLSEFGRPLPCLPASVGNTDYEAYLVVVPAPILASLYDRWGARLLEQNVRCFLQARGKVNKGIRNTILNNPKMFFAYNNGITATAELVDTIQEGDAVAISHLRNLQIVNGGQTTASLFTTWKKDKAELNDIFVQMKLSVVPPEQVIEVVPKISEYANSQNRVNAADFFSNHPFHVRMEEFSRRLWAPSPDGSHVESKWFYERARGQYLDAKSLLSPSDKRKYEKEYPKAQSFTKTDLAKFLNVWDEIPFTVSAGAQKNFAKFAEEIGKKWAKDSDQFNEMFFKHTVAKAIIFRRLEKLVMKQPWYDGGYRANIVAYTISKLASMLANLGKAIDFEQIWKRQDISPALQEALLDIAEEVHGVITNPQAGTSNVTEWAKKQACWSRVQTLSITLPSGFRKELLSKSEQKEAVKNAKKIQKIDNGIDAQKKTLELGASFWKECLDWDEKNRVLTEKDRQIMAVAAQLPNKIPSEKQCLHLMDSIERLREEACPLAQHA